MYGLAFLSILEESRACLLFKCFIFGGSDLLLVVNQIFVNVSHTKFITFVGSLSSLTDIEYILFLNQLLYNVKRKCILRFF